MEKQTKTISEHLKERRVERIANAIYVTACFCLALCLIAFVVAAVTKAARIVADTEARCEDRAPVCAGPAW